MNGSHPALESVAQLLGERTGLYFPPARRDSAEQGIRRAMASRGVTDLDSYRQLIERDDAALDDLISELTVGETYFFREPAQFDFIRQTVLPDVERRCGEQHTLRVWSAGCSSGEEAYSLAILFAEAGQTGRVYLLATDVSRAALARARRATYGRWSLRGPSADAAGPYLSRSGNLFVVDEAIRRSVTIAYLNLARNVYPSFASGTWGMDLVLCRNVLIYFDGQTIRAVARRLYETLAPGGWLLTASSDPPLNEAAPFEPVVTDAGVFYRRPLDYRLPQSVGAEVVPPSRTVAAPPAIDQPRDLATGPDAAALHVRSLANTDAVAAERACAAAALRYPLSAELHYLRAVLLMELGRDEEAAQAVRRVLYLDRSLAVGHMALGTILWRIGDVTGAQRAYRNARDLCAARPPGEVVPLSDGERAGRLAEAAAAQLAVIGPAPEVAT